MASDLMRKYSKPVMVFLGVLLMLTFVISLSTNRGGGSGGGSYAVGTLNGKTITTGDMVRSEIDVAILSGLRWKPLAFLNADPSPATRQIHFYLLLTEARQAGIRTPASEIQPLLGTKNMQKVVATLLRTTQFSRADIERAFQDMQTINQYFEIVISAVQPSGPELDRYIAQSKAKARIVYVKQNAAALAARAPAPSRTALTALFNQYKNVPPPPPGQLPSRIAGHRYPFGFKFPPRVRVEYIVFPYKPMGARFKPTVRDVQAAYQYYQRHADFFMPPATTPAEIGPSLKPRPLPFAKVEGTILARLTQQHIHAFMQRVAARAARLAGRPWGSLTPRGFKGKIKRSSWISLNTIAAQLKSRYKVGGKVVRPPGLLSAGQLDALPGIGKATLVNEAGGKTPFSELALDVRALRPKTTGNTLLLHLQTGVLGPVLTDNAGNFYVYRVINAQPEHAPRALNAVLPQVTRAARLIEAFQRLVRNARTLAMRASHVGLKRAAGAEHLKLAQPPSFTRLTAPRALPTQVVQATFDLAYHRTGASAAGAQLYFGVHPTAMVRYDPFLSVYTFQLVHFRALPPSLLHSPALRGENLQALIQETRFRFFSHFATYAAIAKRMHFVRQR